MPTTQRNGTTDYEQKVGAQETVSSERATEISTDDKLAKDERDLVSTSKSTRSSADFANVGCTISFRIPILGRYPINGTSCQP